jgi:hypothetical protein
MDEPFGGSTAAAVGFTVGAGAAAGGVVAAGAAVGVAVAVGAGLAPAWVTLAALMPDHEPLPATVTFSPTKGLAPENAVDDVVETCT